MRIDRFLLPVFLGLAWASFAGAQGSLSPGQPVKLQADHLEYLKDQGIVTARGRVHVQQGSIDLYADVVRYDLNTQEVKADGQVMFQDGEQTVQAQSFVYNLGTQKGGAFDIESASPPWLYSGQEVSLEPGKVILRGARFSTCEYPEPQRHYHMRASRIVVRPGKSLVARNMVLYIGKVPVFYFPFFYRNLRDYRVPFSFDTGKSDYLGRYGLITTNYLFSSVNYGSLYTDYFERKGWGFGTRHEVELNKYSVLSLYGYRVKEKDTGIARWESRARGTWALNNRLDGRLDVSYPGDGRFSQHYSATRRDPFIVSTLRQYDASASYRGGGFTMGLLFSRAELANPEPEKSTVFDRYSQTAPRGTFNLFPRRLVGRNWLKWDLNTTVERTWTKTNGFYLTRGSAEAGISQSLLLGRTQTLYSRWGLQETFQDKSDKFAHNKGNSRYYSATHTLTSRWTRFWSTTLGHQYRRKLQHLNPQGEFNNGLEQSMINAASDLTAGALLRARTSTTYDMRPRVLGATHRDQRFSYLRQEFYLTPSTRFDTSVMANYALRPKKIKDVMTVLSLRSSRDMWRLRFSGNYMDPRVSTLMFSPLAGKETLDFGAELTFVLFTNYRISVSETYDMATAMWKSRNYSLYRDLHDWEAELNYSQIEGQDKRLSFRLNLKAFPGRPLTVSESELKRWTNMKNQNAAELIQTGTRELQ